MLFCAEYCLDRMGLDLGNTISVKFASYTPETVTKNIRAIYSQG